MELRTQYENNRCRDLFLSGKRDEDLPPDCRDVLKSLSMYAFEGGFAKGCECDHTGQKTFCPNTLC
jgi:hypothetical protein